MTPTTSENSAELSPKTCEMLGRIEDAHLRTEVQAVAELCMAALNELSRLHLPQDHFEEGEHARPPDDKYLELAPYMLKAVASINGIIGYIAEHFEPPAARTSAVDDDAFDLEFDLVDGPTGDGVGLTKDKAEVRTLSPREQVSDTLYAFGGMLRSREQDFAARLRHALTQSDRWPLLSELDDATHRLTKAVQGVMFGVIGVFVKDIKREEILPSYRSGIRESVALRAALTELTYHVNRFNAAIGTAEADTVKPLLVAVSDRLTRFAARSEYRTLRAEDKKAVIDFRASLFALRHQKQIAMAPLAHAVEGFSKFLEAMSAINHREVLVLHDRQRLAMCGERLRTVRMRAFDDREGASIALNAVVLELGAVAGRNPELDDARRDFNPATIGGDAIMPEIARWQKLIDTTMAMVG